MTKKTAPTLSALDTLINSTVAFDHAAQSAAIKAFLELKEANKAKRAELANGQSKAELNVLWPAILYGANTFDLQPLANAIVQIKPSGIAKRAVKAIFPAHVFALIGDEKRPGFVVTEGQAKVADKPSLQVLLDIVESGDSLLCEQAKKAFPEPKTGKAQAMEKLGKALANRMKADNLSKQDIMDILKGL